MRETFLSLGSLTDLVLWRDGGQRQARRNAWQAMVVDNARARARAEADDALTTEDALPTAQMATLAATASST